MSPAGAGGTRLSAIDEATDEPFTLTSPRSLEACAELGLRWEELRHRCLDSFVREAQDGGWVADVGKRQYNEQEKKRLANLRAAKTRYAEICMGKWKSCVEGVLADLHTAIDVGIVLEKEGIYHPDVGKELKSAVAKEGRQYARYPPAYAKGTEADPGVRRVVVDLHAMCRDVVARDKLLETLEEWDAMVERACKLKPQDDGSSSRRTMVPKPVSLQFDQIMNLLEYTYPNVTAAEREDAARHGLVLATASNSRTRAMLVTRPTTASTQRKESVLSRAACSYCGGVCPQIPDECARCKNKTYCTRQCRTVHWTSSHCRECVELRPVEQQASSMAATWIAKNVYASSGKDVEPRAPMPVKWHSIEAELTARSTACDWRGVLRMEDEALVAAKALRPDWPERTIGIYNQFSDCYRELRQPDKALEYSGLSLTVAEQTGNSEMEAQILLDRADFYEFSLKNICKASLCLEQSLRARREANDRSGELRVRVKLGKILLRQDKFAKALEHNKEALLIARELRDTQLQIHLDKELYVCHSKLENFQDALDLRKDEAKRLRMEMVNRNREFAAAKTQNRPSAGASRGHFTGASRGHLQTERPWTSTSAAVPSLSRDGGEKLSARPSTTQSQSRPRIYMITKQERPGSSPYSRFSYAPSRSQPGSVATSARLDIKVDRRHPSPTESMLWSPQTDNLSGSRPQTTSSSTRLHPPRQIMDAPRRDVFARAAEENKRQVDANGCKNPARTFSHFPMRRTDQLTAVTDDHGIKAPTWIRQVVSFLNALFCVRNVSDSLFLCARKLELRVSPGSGFLLRKQRFAVGDQGRAKHRPTLS